MTAGARLPLRVAELALEGRFGDALAVISEWTVLTLQDAPLHFAIGETRGGRVLVDLSFHFFFPQRLSSLASWCSFWSYVVLAAKDHPTISIQKLYAVGAID